MFFTDIPSPVGSLRLASDGAALTGLWLENQAYFAAGLEPEAENRPELPLFQKTAAWLKSYFAGSPLPVPPPLAPRGSEFRRSVWKRLLEIPYGQTVTYRDLAEELGSSPRAVGNAVGHNPISILIPCHRVVGADGSLTGYAGGIGKKRFLLELETRSLDKQRKFIYFPRAAYSENPIEQQESPAPGKYPCPCCGYLTFPVPKEDAIAYICPVCLWENDVFDPGEDRPSDENRGMTLAQGREAFRRLGAVREEFLQYVRTPLPEEIP